MTRREFLAAGTAAATVALGSCLSEFGSRRADKPVKPRRRFSLDPFAVQREGCIVYNYGSIAGEKGGSIEDWFSLKGHNFGGCRDCRVAGEQQLSGEEIRKRWERQNVIPVFEAGIPGKSSVDAARAGWEKGVEAGYRVISIDQFLPHPWVLREYDEELKRFKADHPDVFVQAWETSPVPPEARVGFPHLEILSPFIDAYMPEIYWKWYKDDGARRKMFRDLIGRARRIGTVKKLWMGLGTHDEQHIRKTMEDIPMILDIEPNIGGFGLFIHRHGYSEEYDRLYMKLDGMLADLFQ